MQIKALLFEGRNACFNLAPETAPEIYWTLNYAVCCLNLRPRAPFVYAMAMNLERFGNFCVGNAQLIRMAWSGARVESEKSGGCDPIIDYARAVVIDSSTVYDARMQLNRTRLHLIFHANSSIKTWRKSTNRIGLSVLLSVARPRNCRAVKWRKNAYCRKPLSRLENEKN